MRPKDMLKNKDKVLDDLSKLAGGTVSVISDMSHNFKNDLRAKADEMGERLNWVPRDEYEALEARVTALEKQLKDTAKAPKKKAAAKTKKKT